MNEGGNLALDASLVLLAVFGLFVFAVAIGKLIRFGKAEPPVCARPSSAARLPRGEGSPPAAVPFPARSRSMRDHPTFDDAA